MKEKKDLTIYKIIITTLKYKCSKGEMNSRQSVSMHYIFSHKNTTKMLHKYFLQYLLYKNRGLVFYNMGVLYNDLYILKSQVWKINVFGEQPILSFSYI